MKVKTYKGIQLIGNVSCYPEEVYETITYDYGSKDWVSVLLDKLNIIHLRINMLKDELYYLRKEENKKWVEEFPERFNYNDIEVNILVRLENIMKECKDILYNQNQQEVKNETDQSS